MKKFNFTLCVFLLLTLFVSCERPDYYDEIYDTYRTAERLSTSGAEIDGNMWSAISERPMSSEDAEDYCYYLEELGHRNWRLPTIDELRTLIKDCPKTETDGVCEITDECLEREQNRYDEDEDDDDDYGYGYSYPLCDSSNCSCTQRYSYSNESSYSKLGDWQELWSSLPSRNTNENWYVDFSNAKINFPMNTYSNNYNYVRCVR